MLHAVMLATNDFHLSAQDRVALLLSCSVSVSIRFIFGALLMSSFFSMRQNRWNK